MALTFMWITVHVLLWNCALYVTSASIDPIKTIADKRQEAVDRTKPADNGGKFGNKLMTGIDHTGNPFLRLPLQSGEPSAPAKKPALAPVGSRPKKPNNDSPTKQNRLQDNAASDNGAALRTSAQQSSHPSAASAETGRRVPPNVDHLLRINHGNERTSSAGDSTATADDYLFSSSSSDREIARFLQQDNASPPDPSAFANQREPWNAAMSNRFAADFNAAPEPWKSSFQHRPWTAQKQSYFDSLSSATADSQFSESPASAGGFPSPTFANDEQNESSKFLQLVPQTSNPKFVYHTDPKLENKLASFPSFPNRFTVPPFDDQQRLSDYWPGESNPESQSIPPAIALPQKPRPTTGQASKPAAAKPQSEPISVSDEQREETTDLVESSKPTDTSTTSEPTDQAEPTSLPPDGEPQQNESSGELTENPAASISTSEPSPPPAEEGESTSPPAQEHREENVTDAPETSETPSAIAPTEKEESTSVPSKPPANTPPTATKPTPIALDKEQPFVPQQRPLQLDDWSSTPPITGYMSQPFPKLNPLSMLSPEAYNPYKINQHGQHWSNAPQSIAPGEFSEYYNNDAYRQTLQQSFYAQQPTRDPFQSAFSIPNFPKPSLNAAIPNYYYSPGNPVIESGFPAYGSYNENLNLKMSQQMFSANCDDGLSRKFESLPFPYQFHYKR